MHALSFFQGALGPFVRFGCQRLETCINLFALAVCFSLVVLFGQLAIASDVAWVFTEAAKAGLAVPIVVTMADVVLAVYAMVKAITVQKFV